MSNKKHCKHGHVRNAENIYISSRGYRECKLCLGVNKANHLSSRSKLCSIEGCKNFSKARTWCGAHWERWKRWGDPTAYAPLDDPIKRFWDKVKKTDFCWEWIGALSVTNYGLLGVGGKILQAHRFSYELAIGKIPKNLDIDHLCRNTRCVNPKHLEPVTRSENVKRQWKAIRGAPLPKVLSENSS